jgi:hypothetical protein
MKFLLTTLAITTVAAVSVGCATTPVPADKLARSQAAVRSAEEMNAQSDPQAALHLRMAQDQLNSAKRMLKDGDNEEARFTLMRAEADADVALNLARGKAAKVDAEQTKERIQQTQSQMTTTTEVSR